MKILLRALGKDQYKWFDAIYSSDYNNFMVNGNIIAETSIVAVHEDNRNEYVKCSKCGKSFKRGSKESTEHVTPVMDTSKCLECGRLRYTPTEDSKVSYTKRNDGLYVKTETMPCILKCAASGYPYDTIESENARTYCIHNTCKNANMLEFSDFFTENPGVFDHIITKDRLEALGHIPMSGYDSTTEYKLNLRNQVWAVANKLGIIDHFILTYRRETYTLYYSKTNNMVYYINDRKYCVWDPYNMPESSKQMIRTKLAELYSEMEVTE